MSRTGAELIAEILEDLKISKVFGNPGTTELPFINAISKTESIDYIQALHEDIAVGIASGYSQKMLDYYNTDEVYTPLSIVNLHTTPGLLHGAGNIYNSKFSNSPVIITTGSQDPNHENKNPMLNGEREQTIQDYVKWSETVTNVDDIPYVFRRAAREALTPPMGPVYIDIPIPIQTQYTEEAPRPIGSIPRINKAPRSELHPAVDLIDQSNDPLIFVGDHIANEGEHSINSVKDLAHTINAPVYGEILLSKTSYPMNDEHWIGILGADESPQEIEYTPDLILQIGSSMNTALLQENQKQLDVPVIEIASNSSHLQYSERSDHSLLGHIGGTVAELVNMVQKKEESDLQKYRAKRQQQFKNQAESTNTSKLPTRYDVAQSTNEALSDNYTLIDEGVTTGFMLRNLLEQAFGQFNGTKGGGLGEGLPLSVGFAIAEQELDKNSTIISFIGDGAFQYYPQTLYTATRYDTCPLKVVVANNNGYEILKEPDDEDTDELDITDALDVPQIAQGYGMTQHSLVNKNDLKTQLESLFETEENLLINIPIE